MTYHVNKKTLGIYPAGEANMGPHKAVRIVSGAYEKPANGGEVAGVVLNDTNLDGEVLTVQVDGIAKMVCATSTLAIDSLVTVDTDGKVRGVAGSGDFIVGQILEAGASGKVVPVRLTLNSKA